MAKPLQFLLNAETFDGVPVKLERSKLYGHVDTVATDAAGGVCVSASLERLLRGSEVRGGKDGIIYQTFSDLLLKNGDLVL